MSTARREVRILSFLVAEYLYYLSDTRIVFTDRSSHDLKCHFDAKTGIKS